MRLFPDGYCLLAAVVMVLLHFELPGLRWLGWPWRVIGAAPIIIGLWINITSDQQFKRRGTTVRPFQKSSTLVTDGMFQHSRNPMYLGMVLILTGIWVLLGSLTPVIFIPLFAWWVDTKFIRKEEKALTQQFGREYVEYMSRVRRWL
jgi:protein-S-isoprenylcysteine O-methyltransferase Ste14